MSNRIWRKPKQNRVALIDADGVLYAAALKGETVCDGEQLQLLSDEAIIKECHKRLNIIAERLHTDRLYIVLSDRTCFRKDIYPTYKDNRKGNARPIGLNALRESIMEDPPAGFTPILIKGLEADDVCGIMSGVFQARGDEAAIYSPDKDLLQIPGITLTPARNGSVKVSVIDEERADRWHLYQTMVGDNADNYPGLPGFGPRKTDRLLDYYEDMPKAERWQAIVHEFEKKGLTEEDALLQARVARICRVSDWDAEKKEVILWQPPKED